MNRRPSQEGSARVRKLTTIIVAFVTVLGLTLVFTGSASARITSPASGSTLHGTVTLSDDGGYDSGHFYCGSASTTIELRNSANRVVFSHQWSGEGARSIAVDTHDYPNGSYKVRGIDHNVFKDGFLNLGCGSNTDTDTNNVTISNRATVNYTGATSAPATTSVTVSAKLTDRYSSSYEVAGRAVSFHLSGGATVTDTTNSSGVATATMPISGPPRNATVTATFNGDAFFVGDSDSSGFTVKKQPTKVTVESPADVVFGEPTHFVAHTEVTEGSGTPSGGTVQFTVDGANFGAPVPNSGGTATSASTSTLSTGAHTIKAVYGGNGSYEGSTSGGVTQNVNKAQTTTSLSQDLNPTVYGQTVTFTAEVNVVAPGAGNLTGTVQFTIDGQPFGTAKPLSGNNASVQVSLLHAGNHDVEARYNGNANFAASDSATIVHGVDQAQTSVNLATSDTNAVSGQPLTFTATVSPTGSGAGDPSGTMTFFADGEQIGNAVTIVNGSATSDAVGLLVGTHEITATYSGDGDFAGSATTFDQEVAAAATSTTLTSLTNPSVFGQPVEVHAEVTPEGPATGDPVGAIKFVIDGGTDTVFANLVDGAADVSVPGLSVGTHTIVATYLSGDANFVTSTSDPLSQQVNKAATSTAVTSSSPTSVFGQPVTFTATVSVVAPGAGSPSGTITFTDGSEVLGTAAVDSSTGEQASIQVSNLSVAQHAIVATYDGDGSFQGSSGSVTQKVEKAHTSTLVTSSANPAESGQPVAFTARVTPVAPGAGEPAGTVTFTVNGAPLGGAVTLSNGEATSSTFATLSPGTYTIAATYSGNAQFIGSTGGLDQGAGLDVVRGATTMALDSSANPADFGTPVTFVASVTAVAPATGHPSGVVQFWEGRRLLGASNLVAGDGANKAEAQFVTSTLSPGAHAIEAVYVGNFNFDGVTAATSQSIGQASSVTGIMSAPNPSTFGEDVALTATVTGALGAPGVPTGVVTFREGSTVLGTAPLNAENGGQKASLVVAGLQGGDHVVTASYAGDGSFAASTSPEHTQHVGRAASAVQAATLVTIDGDSVDVKIGIVEATVTGLNGEPLVGEPVIFTTTRPGDHAVLPMCQAVTDDNGLATCVTPILDTILVALGQGYDAMFAGNANYLPATDHGSQF